ncbi:hypothetical protein Asera_37210 [Actinocatenispora sera]|uniref:Uncharacterized protein n=1 Tax=Actinocatenispora sera TaxID=390989 RepID=A0A810L2I0_9ACTN|nr:hypothetical protein Asera_37210 [Actinocatenispora sera]
MFPAGCVDHGWMRRERAVTRKHEAAALAAPGIDAIRDAYLTGGSDAQRVAALIEIAGAAAALARTVAGSGTWIG